MVIIQSSLCRLAVSGVGGDRDLEMLRQGLLVAEPGVLSQLVVEDDEGRARAGLEDLEVGAGDGDDIFGVGGCGWSHRATIEE